MGEDQDPLNEAISSPQERSGHFEYDERGVGGAAMLVSNQRPLPCESEACSFATVRRYPISAFPSQILR